MGPLHKQKWNDPLSSVGEYRGMTDIKTAGMFAGKKCCWEAKDGSPASTALKQLLPKINGLFQTSGNRVPDSAMVLMDIFMIGESPEESIPYIMFSCPNTCKRARIEAMNLVRKSGLLKEFPGLKASHWEFPPHIPDLELTMGDPIRSITASPQESSLGTTSNRTTLEIFLSATRDGKVDISTSQTSTIGAIVRSGKCVLYFTAAHLLLPESDIAEGEHSLEGNLSDTAEFDSVCFSGDDSTYEFEDDAESIGSSTIGQHIPLVPGQNEDLGDHSPSDRSLSLNTEIGQLETATRCDETEDVPSPTGPSQSTKIEVFFKSHELDFALLDLSDLEVPPCDIPEIDHASISAINAGSTSVVAYTGSMRNLHGQMSGRPSYIRFPHGGIYQEVYPVLFTEDVRIGDSGSLVRDASTGKIFGHIVVASFSTAFIVPAMKVLEAIQWLTTVLPRIYTPLDYNSGHLRLVRLLPPSSSSDAICCELFLAVTTAQPEYEALSYVWGEEKDTRPILLNGQLWDVSPGLAAALRRLRYKSTERYLWIDALCIDQTNAHEKSDKSRHIGEVFRRCEKCLIWLGDVYDEPSSSSNKWAFALTHPSSNQPLKFSRGDAISYRDACLAFSLIAQFESLHGQKQDASRDDSKLFVPSECQNALGNLMALSWWNRFWAFRNAISARSVSLICGKMDMTLDSVGIAASTMRKYLRNKAKRPRGDALDFDVVLPFLRTVGRLQSFQQNRVPNDPTFVMNSVRDLDCSDRRDKVFALLDFHDVQPTHGMDYSYQINRICEWVVMHKMLSVKTLFPLVRTREIGRHPLLPSWVPDWSASIGSKSEFHSELSFIMCWELFDASWGKESLVSVHDHTLHVQGLLIDRVSTTYSPMESGIDLPARMFNLASQLRRDSTSQSSKLVGKGRTSQLIGALILERRARGSYSHGLWRLFTSDIRVSKHDVMEWRRARDSDWGACRREYHKGILGPGVRGRMPFLTEARFFGLGPAEMKVGDVVVVLYGGNFPFILRPTANHQYNLVGYAYVSGIMDGEAVSDLIEPQTFEIV